MPDRAAPEPKPVSKGLPLPPIPSEFCEPAGFVEDAAVAALELDDEEEDDGEDEDDGDKVEVVRVVDVAESMEVGMDDDVDAAVLVLVSVVIVVADSVLLPEAADLMLADAAEWEVAVTIVEESAAVDSVERAVVVVAPPLLFVHR